MNEQVKMILSGGKEEAFPASDQALSQVIAFTEEILESFDCSMKNQMAITVALEEIFVNVAHYAYDGSEGNLRLTVAVGDLPEGRAAILQICDHGMAFDPLAHEDPDVNLPAEERKIGGLGILMVKKMMDDVQYIYENGENQLTIVKYF